MNSCTVDRMFRCRHDTAIYWNWYKWLSWWYCSDVVRLADILSLVLDDRIDLIGQNQDIDTDDFDGRHGVHRTDLDLHFAEGDICKNKPQQTHCIHYTFHRKSHYMLFDWFNISVNWNFLFKYIYPKSIEEEKNQQHSVLMNSARKQMKIKYLCLCYNKQWIEFNSIELL